MAQEVGSVLVTIWIRFEIALKIFGVIDMIELVWHRIYISHARTSRVRVTLGWERFHLSALVDIRC